VSVVADNSVVMSWFFEEEQTAAALTILKLFDSDTLLVPPLWWSELENGIVMGERRGRKTPAESAAFLKLVKSLPIKTDDAPRHRVNESIIEIARQHQLTAYDAAYAELSLREASPLASFDAALRRCATKLGLKLLPKNGK
jgi:predicted nucleic acid-binding protein